MKLLTFAIPCYNSQDYMEHCIDSILPGGDDVEILIIDDGSKDRPAEIADAYEEKYPNWWKSDIINYIGKAKKVFLIMARYKNINGLKALSKLHSRMVG